MLPLSIDEVDLALCVVQRGVGGKGNTTSGLPWPDGRAMR